MIRSYKPKDLDPITHIWLESNLQVHNFISEDYWKDNYKNVKKLLPESEVYVYEDNNKIIGFVGIQDSYIAGIFVLDEMRSKGIGKALILKCKQQHENLALSVYKKNIQAVHFYEREGFQIKDTKIDRETKEQEHYMEWVDEENVI